jgi:predicted lipase
MKINPNKKKIYKNDFIEKSFDFDSDSDSCQEQHVQKKMRIKKL